MRVQQPRSLARRHTAHSQRRSRRAPELSSGAIRRQTSCSRSSRLCLGSSRRPASARRGRGRCRPLSARQKQQRGAPRGGRHKSSGSCSADECCAGAGHGWRSDEAAEVIRSTHPRGNADSIDVINDVAELRPANYKREAPLGITVTASRQAGTPRPVPHGHRACVGAHCLWLGGSPMWTAVRSQANGSDRV